MYCWADSLSNRSQSKLHFVSKSIGGHYDLLPSEGIIVVTVVRIVVCRHYRPLSGRGHPRWVCQVPAARLLKSSLSTVGMPVPSCTRAQNFVKYHDSYIRLREARRATPKLRQQLFPRVKLMHRTRSGPDLRQSYLLLKTSRDDTTLAQQISGA
jgi:hypothetical protein